MTEKLTIEEVNALDGPAFVARFGGVLEDSPHLAERTWRSRPFRDVGELAGAFRTAMYSASDEDRLELVRAHPDLAGKAAVAGELSSESAGEQASAGLDRLSPEQYEAFTRMNAAYREKFGIPMIVCAREHTRESILENAEARLANAYEEEFRTALGEISRIAELRLRDLVEDEREW